MYSFIKKIGVFFWGMVILTTAFSGEAPRDLDAIQKSGELRVMMTLKPNIDVLPRGIYGSDYEMVLIRRIATQLNLNIKILYYPKVDDLIPAMLDGQGDLIVANLTITPERAKQIAFSNPVTQGTEQLVCKRGTPFKSLDDLNGQKIVLERGTSFWGRREALQKKYPKLVFEEAPLGIGAEELLYEVSRGRYPFTITDSSFVFAVQAYMTDLQVVHVFPEKCYLAWGVHPKAKLFLEKVNSFLGKARPEEVSRHTVADLPEIQKKGLIRIITTNNPYDYFIYRGCLMGFEYDLTKKFADSLGLRTVIIVARNWDDLFTMLRNGEGDIVASSVSITPTRLEQKEFVFGPSYGSLREVLIARAKDPITSCEELRGRKIVVRQGSAYWETLEELQKKIPFNLMVAPGNMEEFEIIDQVAQGKFDLTVVDEPVANAELRYRSDVKIVSPVGLTRQYGWVLRANNPELKAAVDKFFKETLGTPFYNQIYAKYYRNAEKTIKHVASVKGRGVISTYDDFIKKYARQYGFPWTLIASQIFQESAFDPQAKSWAGSCGLMQLMPATAAEVGFKENYWEPESNIHAGIKYLARLRQRFPNEMSGDDMIWFALASYNCGYGHVVDAMRLAEMQNKDPNKWFHNVEITIALLEKPEYASRARYGYCRSRETINYLREIVSRYRSYQQMIKEPKKN